MKRLMDDDTRIEAVTKLAENNPSAAMAIVGLMQYAEQRGKNPVLPLLQLDSASVYGGSIWMLHQDVCGRSSEKVSNVLDAWQRGDISDKSLHHAIQNRGAGISKALLDGKSESAFPSGLKEPPLPPARA